MNTTGRTYVAAATIALVAMVSRVGWIDYRLLAALMVGVPATLVVAGTMGFLGPIPKSRAGKPQA